MLVLTRRIGEQIVIGDTIRVTVTAIQGDRVRLGITAPASVRVDRKEVHDRYMGFAADADQSHTATADPQRHAESEQG
ncbi:MAG TPA: carbon storage regulator [Gemmataceae bacterium]|jgi:carbon storage regulator|nr:carbon storage regulator [Gemmataceae bacterium]